MGAGQPGLAASAGGQAATGGLVVAEKEMAEVASQRQGEEPMPLVAGIGFCQRKAERQVF